MRIFAVVPSYKSASHIVGLLNRFGKEVERIIVVDDKCPEHSGQLVLDKCKDPRVLVIFHEQNQGVGGAMKTGYLAALEGGADIVVKVDSDGQMPPESVPAIVRPIIEGHADYVKGNRFFEIESLTGMPAIRIFGNAVVSFLSKAASGYWNLMDPANGFTAIHADAARLVPWRKIDCRYFFESDLLFRLNTIRAVVTEVPMIAVYKGEKSSLSVSRVALEFPGKYLLRLFKRIFYNYFLRDFNLCSLEIVVGCLLMLGGLFFGMRSWAVGSVSGEFASAGTIAVAGLPIILGFQLLLAAASFDVMNLPKVPLHRFFGSNGKKATE